MNSINAINLNLLNHHAGQSKNIRVDDIVQIFYCDLLIYSSSNDDDTYIYTTNLNGENILKKLLASIYISLNTARPKPTTPTNSTPTPNRT